jgi:hypothetical protein
MTYLNPGMASLGSSSTNHGTKSMTKNVATRIRTYGTMGLSNDEAGVLEIEQRIIKANPIGGKIRPIPEAATASNVKCMGWMPNLRAMGYKMG